MDYDLNQDDPNPSDTPAGKYMDALVAARVLKWKVVGNHQGYPPDSKILTDIPKYSTDLNLAWGVFEKTKRLYTEFKVWDQGEQTCHTVEVSADKEYMSGGETMSEAICRVVLKMKLGQDIHDDVILDDASLDQELRENKRARVGKSGKRSGESYSE